MRIFVLSVLFILAIPFPATAQQFHWVGMRNPCKVSGEDGLNEKQLDKKIGKFILLPNADAWVNAIFNVQSRFPKSRPWVTWSVGAVRDAQPVSDATQEACLTRMDELGVDVYLELAPEKNDNVSEMIDVGLAKLKHHPSVKGLGVDLEFFKHVDDATAKAWDEQIKAVNPSYRLFFKHWEETFMPPTYRGKGDIIFINTSSEASVDALNDEFANWAHRYAPSAVAFQIGYPADEDGMNGDKTKGWFALRDPIGDWGEQMLTKLGNTDQQIGLLWVCAKSGKTYNSQWDLTKGAQLPSGKR
jgi:hypothetical protein